MVMKEVGDFNFIVPSILSYLTFATSLAISEHALDTVSFILILLSTFSSSASNATASFRK